MERVMYWCMDKLMIWVLGPVAILGTIGLVVIGLVAGVYALIHRNDKDEPNPWTCNASVQTGTRLVMVGKVMTRQPVYRCIMSSRMDPQGIRIANDSTEIVVTPDLTVVR